MAGKGEHSLPLLCLYLLFIEFSIPVGADALYTDLADSGICMTALNCLKGKQSFFDFYLNFSFSMRN